MADPIHVGSQADLNNAIEQLDTETAAGKYVISIDSDIVEGEAGEPAGLYALVLNTGVTVTIEGNGHTIDGGGSRKVPLEVAAARALAAVFLLDLPRPS
jgi:hypothetical protein